MPPNSSGTVRPSQPPSADCRMIIQIIGLTEGDQLLVEMNGSEVPAADLSWDLKSEPPTCSLQISTPRFRYGDNHLGVILVDSLTHEGAITIERLDCHVS